MTVSSQKPCDRGRVFRDFDEDDLDSYLEGSLISERLGELTADTNSPRRIITIFPCMSATSPMNTNPCALETVFTSKLETIFRSRYPGSSQNVYDTPSPQPVQTIYRDTRTNGKVVTAVSRPGSPGPVAGAGDVINTPHGFTIQLDVKLFNPEEIKVVLTDDMLCVSGERIEEGTGGQTLKRSFARKYCIPSDIQLDSIRSHLDHHGLLVITGSRRGWKETNISIHPRSTYTDRRADSVISTV